jgi:hypothetical protein
MNNHRTRQLIHKSEVEKAKQEGIDLTFIRWMLSLTLDESLQALQDQLE